jgi:hypothetical protein
MPRCPVYVAPIDIPWPDPRPNRFDLYVGSYLASLNQWGTTPCYVCGTPWHSHKNIHPGWVERSNAMRVQIGLHPNIVLGED